MARKLGVAELLSCLTILGLFWNAGACRSSPGAKSAGAVRAGAGPSSCAGTKLSGKSSEP